MSASLVGSEMCIRDSLPPANGKWQGEVNAIARSTRKRPQIRTARSEGNCLLYTSDAADDM
eukprot:11832629-Alexandrium_andersonii.AAC.1